MAELKQHAWLLSLVAILIIAKFIVVPVFDWQAEILAEITLLEKQQSKITKVLGQKNNTTSANSGLMAALKQAEGLFFPFKTETSFKLTQQKMLEVLLAKYDIRSQHIGWQTATNFKELAVIRYPIQLRFTGKTKDVIDFMVALEAKNELIEINDFNLSLKRQSEQRLGNINGRLTLHFFVNEAAMNISQESTVSGESS